MHNNDDTQSHDATMTGTDRYEPAPTGTDRHSPAMSSPRSEKHTLTTREVMKMFEDAGVPRNQRTMQRYCQDGNLDCFLDTLEQQYYITPQSAEILIGQLKEIAARHQKIQTNTAQQINATPDDNPRQPPTDEAVKRGTPEKRDEKHRAGEDEQAIEALQARLKELENQNFKLEIDKSAQDQVIGMMRDQMTQQTKEFSNQLTEQSRRVGQLETEMRQLMAPKHDRRPTRDDDGAPDVAAPIDAEFIDASRVAQDELDDVQTNHASQP